MVDRAVFAMLLSGCGGGAICGSTYANDPVDLERVTSCVSIEGELIIGAGFREALSLPNLVEVRDRVDISDVADLDLPNLERVGFGVSRGDLSIRGAAGRVSAPRLISVGRGHYAEDDDTFLNEHGVYISAAAPTDVELPLLENPGQVVLDGIGRAPNLGAVRTGSLTLIGAMPERLSFPAVYGTVRVRSTSGLTELDVGLPQAQQTVELTQTADLSDVRIDAAQLDALVITENQSLAAVSAPNLTTLRSLSAQDNATAFTLDLGDVTCVESVIWTRNAGEPPAQAAECD